ncbi:MAG: DUF3307 domain-containing protein [Pedobacter sp.]
MEINLLLRLIIAHLLTDFVFQPTSWVRDREQRQGRSIKLYVHVTVTTIVAYLISGAYDNWVIPLVIFSSHLLIDYVKSKFDSGRFSYFIIDQLAHLAVILVLWLSLEGKWSMLPKAFDFLNNSSSFWLIATGYLFVSWPLGILIGKATQKWRDQISRETVRAPEGSAEDTDQPVASGEEQELGLANAGKWIGICERILIFTFVLLSQYTAIGFLMTAKSILRFSEKESNTQLKTEYVLVGTLVSFTLSAMIGMGIKIMLPA